MYFNILFIFLLVNRISAVYFRYDGCDVMSSSTAFYTDGTGQKLLNITFVNGGDTKWLNAQMFGRIHIFDKTDKNLKDLDIKNALFSALYDYRWINGYYFDIIYENIIYTSKNPVSEYVCYDPYVLKSGTELSIFYEVGFDCHVDESTTLLECRSCQFRDNSLTAP